MKVESASSSGPREPNSLEATAYEPAEGDWVRDLRPQFGGRVGTSTCLIPYHGPVRMLFVRPLDWEGERHAEWNVAPEDVERAQETQLVARAVPVGCYLHVNELWIPVTGVATMHGRTRLTVEGRRLPLEYGEEEFVEVCPAVPSSRTV